MERRGTDQECPLIVGAAPGEEAGIHVGAQELRHQAAVGWRRAVHACHRRVTDRLMGHLRALLLISDLPGILKSIRLCERPGGRRTAAGGGVCEDEVKIQEPVQIFFVFPAQAAALHVGPTAHFALPLLVTDDNTVSFRMQPVHIM